MGPAPRPPNARLSSQPFTCSPGIPGGPGGPGTPGGPCGREDKNQRGKRAPCHVDGSGVRRESRDRRQDKGDKPHTPAGPAARSCPSTVPEHPGWEWGPQKKGRGYRQRRHQAQSCMGRVLAGTQSLARALAPWHQVRPGSRPLPRWGRWESSSAPLTGMPEKMGSPREAQEHSPGSPWKDKSLGLKWQRQRVLWKPRLGGGMGSGDGKVRLSLLRHVFRQPTGLRLLIYQGMGCMQCVVVI